MTQMIKMRMRFLHLTTERLLCDGESIQFLEVLTDFFYFLHFQHKFHFIQTFLVFTAGRNNINPGSVNATVP